MLQQSTQPSPNQLEEQNLIGLPTLYFQLSRLLTPRRGVALKCSNFQRSLPPWNKVHFLDKVQMLVAADLAGPTPSTRGPLWKYKIQAGGEDTVVITATVCASFVKFVS